MAIRRLRTVVRLFAGIAGAVVVALPGAASPTGSTVPFGGHGKGYDNTFGTPVPLTATSFLAAANGPDETNTTADDRVLLVTGLGGTPVVTPLSTPYTGGNSSRIVRLSATRALVPGAGPDGEWNTGDEVLHVLDGLGGANAVSSIPVGRLDAFNGHTPVALSPTSAAVTSWGPDGTYPTADDLVILVTGIGGTHTLTPLPAPNIPWSGRARPTALSPTSMLLVSAGPDANDTTADDVTYLWTDLGGSNTRTDLATPHPIFGRPGQPVRLAGDRALLASEGPDSSSESADDGVLLLDKLGTANKVTAIDVPYLSDYAAGYIVPVDRQTALTIHWGVDGVEGTADDALVLLEKLGASNDVTSIPVGKMDEDYQCRPVFLPPSSAAVVTYGPDLATDTADDEVVVVSDLGGTPVLSRVTVGGLAGGTTSGLAVLSSTSVALCCGGIDHDIDAGGDDAIAVVSGIGTAPVVETVPLGGDVSQTYGFNYVPVPVGAGRALAFTPGPNGTLGGADDGVLVLDGLPVGHSLWVKTAALKFKGAKPEKGEKAAVKGTLLFDGPAPFGLEDVTVTVGNAAQTLPAGLWTERRGNWTWSDPKGLDGFVRKVTWKWKKGALAIKTKGVATGMETTSAGSVAVAVSAGETHLGLALPGTAGKSGIKYRAPK